MQHETTLIKSGLRYAVTNEIYPPKYSIVELIGDNGGYTHIQLWNNKRGATAEIVDNGGILCEYKEPTPAASTSTMPEGEKVFIVVHEDKLWGEMLRGTKEQCEGYWSRMEWGKDKMSILEALNPTTTIESKEGYTKLDWIKQDKPFNLKGGEINISAIAVLADDIPLAYVIINNQIDAKEAESNAQLIASAPTLKKERDSLLSVLEKIVPWMESLKGKGVFVPDSLADHYLSNAKALLFTLKK